MTKYIKGRWYSPNSSNEFYRCDISSSIALSSDMKCINGEIRLKRFTFHFLKLEEVDPNTVLNSINLEGKSKEEILEIAKIFFYEGVRVRSVFNNEGFIEKSGEECLEIFCDSVRGSVGTVYDEYPKKWAEILSTPEGWTKHLTSERLGFKEENGYKEWVTNSNKTETDMKKKQTATKEDMRVFLSLTKNCSSWTNRLNEIMLRGYKQDALRDSFEWEDSEIELAFKEASETQRKALEKVFKLEEEEFKVGDEVLVGTNNLKCIICDIGDKYYLISLEGLSKGYVWNNRGVNSLSDIYKLALNPIVKAK